MISRTDLVERSREWGLREDIVEKDYALGWLLWGIGSNPALSRLWVFKGGTCLKKCYLETYRFSEDLDFTILPENSLKPDEVLSILRDVSNGIYEQSGVDFRVRPAVLRKRPDGRSFEGRVYFRGPRNNPEVASIKLDLTEAEQVVRPTVQRQISHPYPDPLPYPSTIMCYSFEELFAEKLRALGERLRPRDLYDIVNLFRRHEFRPYGELIHSVYVQKCKTKRIEVFTIDSLEHSLFRTELEMEWGNMLGHQLPVLPPFESFWDELPDIFGWLEGKLAIEELPKIPVAGNEDSDWEPPPTVQVWGQGVPVELVRFAAANQLCVEVGYSGTRKLIEPYGLRTTRDGSLVLYAAERGAKELQTYRLDRIQSIKMTGTPFKPGFAMEFGSAEDLIIPWPGS